VAAFAGSAEHRLHAPAVAVFVDGCFWHGCPEHDRRNGRANASYWTPNIARNCERDAEHDGPPGPRWEDLIKNDEDRS
jgi:G:T-mismatch repair DNA endonuclease (very short patch repair protein)